MPSKLGLSADRIDEATPLPLYEQIYNLLRDKILDGTLGLNDLLPAEQSFVEQLGVSRITVKRAINELAASGLVRRQRGFGTVVIHDASAPITKGSFDTMLEGLARMGAETEVSLIECEMITASPAISARLELRRSAKVQRIVRVRSLDGRPLSHIETYIPANIAKQYNQKELRTAAMIDILDRAGHAPVEAEQTISAITAKPAIAAQLGIAAGAALLRVNRVMRNAEGIPVQDITVHYRADRFEYHMRFSRNAGEGWT